MHLPLAGHILRLRAAYRTDDLGGLEWVSINTDCRLHLALATIDFLVGLSGLIVSQEPICFCGIAVKSISVPHRAVLHNAVHNLRVGALLRTNPPRRGRLRQPRHPQLSPLHWTTGPVSRRTRLTAGKATDGTIGSVAHARSQESDATLQKSHGPIRFRRPL